MTTAQQTEMDGQSRFLRIAELKREMYAEGCTDERAAAIQVEIRRINAKPKAARKPKEQKAQYMTVLGGYVLDMHNHGHLVGFRDADGNVRDRHTGQVIGR